MSFNSVIIAFDKNNTFENNLGIYGGGIPFYNSTKLLLKKQTYIYFVNNHARSGGGIFVSQLHVPDIYIKCSFQVTHNSKGLVYTSSTIQLISQVYEVEDCIISEVRTVISNMLTSQVIGGVTYTCVIHQ